MKNERTVTFKQFAFHSNVPDVRHAEAVRDKIQSGEFKPLNNDGERFYKSAGYEFDIGRLPFLIDDHGAIYRAYALSGKELRDALGLSRSARCIPDPFAGANHV